MTIFSIASGNRETCFCCNRAILNIFQVFNVEFTSQMTCEGICSAQSKPYCFYIQIILELLISWLKSFEWKAPYLVSNFLRRALIYDFAGEESRKFCIWKLCFVSDLELEIHFDHTFLWTVFYGIGEKLVKNTVVDFVIGANFVLELFLDVFVL